MQAACVNKLCQCWLVANNLLFHVYSSLSYYINLSDSEESILPIHILGNSFREIGGETGELTEYLVIIKR